MAYVTINPSVATGFAGRIQTWFADFGKSLQSYRMYRQTFNELSNLTDRELDDIGLTRADIRAAAGYHLTNR